MATHYKDLRDFIVMLESRGDLKRVTQPVSPVLEMTEICDRVLRARGPAILFENVPGYRHPVLANLFGTPERVALAMSPQSADTPDATSALREIGELLAFLRQPEPPRGLREAFSQLPIFRKVLDMAPRTVRTAPSREIVLEGDAVDLSALPVQTCWPGDAGPLLTWGLVITKGPHKERQNLGIYRQQVIGQRRLIMRWLAHRGGALDLAEWWQRHPSEPFPIAVAIGADPATTLAAVTPLPDALSEYAFAGLLRGGRTEVIATHDGRLQVPARAEFILEGTIAPGDTAAEGPFGDHTGYYNEVEQFPVFTVDRLTHRADAIYHTTYTGRPPDEPAILGVALNEVFVPLIKKQFPEIVDFYLPPEGCSYRLAVVTIRKAYPGHAKRVMLGVWSYLRQFMYTKFIIVTDDDIDARNWEDVIWAVTTRADPQRDLTVVENAPIDYLDFASPAAGLGGKLGIDATNKLAGETTRAWGRPIAMSESVRARVDALWPELGL